MASEKEKLYLKLRAGYYAAFPAKPKQTAQQNVNEVWNSLKKNSEDISSAVHTKLEEWKSVELKRKATLMSFWSKVRDECLDFFNI